MKRISTKRAHRQPTEVIRKTGIGKRLIFNLQREQEPPGVT
jgi:hypothetical protein